MKKPLLMGMVLVLVAILLCLPVAAEENCETIFPRPAWNAALDSVQEGRSLVDAVGDVAVASYLLSQKSAGRMSFSGYCGLLTSHQLYNLGINKYLYVTDGNGQFDYYAAREITTGGYFINTYASENYTLEEALNAICDYGNKDVFNILVGFQWTNTAAGGMYGHSLVINGIVDGNLYFVESFNSPLGVSEGGLLTCTISEFVRAYDGWTLFEGIVHFGDGEYRDVCPTTSTDLTVQARFESVLRTQPALLGKKGSEEIRSVAAGEKFRAIGICRDTRGEYYKVCLEEGFGYISAAAVSVLAAGDGEMTLSGVQLPRSVPKGQDVTLLGTVSAAHGKVASLEVIVSDQEGNILRRQSAEVNDRSGDLSALNGQLYGYLLEPGLYSVELYAYSICPVAGNQWGQSRYLRVHLGSRYLEITEGGSMTQ